MRSQPLTFLPLSVPSASSVDVHDHSIDEDHDSALVFEPGSHSEESHDAHGVVSSSAAEISYQSGADGQQRVSLACMRCRKQKLKCDGASPVCTRCAKRNAECVYSNEPTGRKNGSKKKVVRRDKKRSDDSDALRSSSSSLVTSSSGLERSARTFKDLILPSQRPAPQIIALEQLSRKLKMELDSYTTMAKHWQEQLTLLRKGGPSAVTDKSAVAWLKREMKPVAPKEPNGRPTYLPKSRVEGEAWNSYTSESHPAIHLAHSMVAFSDRSLVANPLPMMQDPSQVDLRCHRFRLMRFWDMSSPRELLTDTLSYDTLVAAWDILLQPINTIIQGNSFVDEIGRPLEDDLEETRTMDSIAFFAHTASIEEVLAVMEFGCLFFHATQLVGWEDQMRHLITNVDRLMHVAFFQRNLSNEHELADRTVNFILWYVWRYKAFGMMTAYRTTLNLGYQVLLSNFDHISPYLASSLNSLLVSAASSHAQLMHHVHLAERIPHTPLKKALLGLAVAIVTLNRPDSQAHHYEKLEADYPELVRIIETIENPFDLENRAIASTALFLHAEVLVRLGRDVRLVEDLINAAVSDVMEAQSCGAVHLLFSNMFLFQATVNTVVQFSSGVTCTVSDYARIELAKALGFPLSPCSSPHEDVKHSEEPCRLKFGTDFVAVLSRMGQLQPCNGTCERHQGEPGEGETCTGSCSSEVVTPNSEGHTHHHHSSPRGADHEIVVIQQQQARCGGASPSYATSTTSSSSSSVSWSDPSSVSSPFGATSVASPSVAYEHESVSASSTSPYFPDEYATTELTDTSMPIYNAASLPMYNNNNNNNTTTTTTTTTTNTELYYQDSLLSSSQTLEPSQVYPLTMSGEHHTPWNESLYPETFRL